MLEGEVAELRQLVEQPTVKSPAKEEERKLKPPSNYSKADTGVASPRSAKPSGYSSTQSLHKAAKPPVQAKPPQAPEPKQEARHDAKQEAKQAAGEVCA
jgi:hypothetical protein